MFSTPTPEATMIISAREIVCRPIIPNMCCPYASLSNCFDDILQGMKIRGVIVVDMLYADDCTLVADTPQKL